MSKEKLSAFAVGAGCFLLGAICTNASAVLASVGLMDKPVTEREFMLSVDEVKQNFVFGERFNGKFEREFTLSDGSKRKIMLTPVLKNGKPYVELNDGGHISYMGLSGTTTNGDLMISLRDMASVEELHKAYGY